MHMLRCLFWHLITVENVRRLDLLARTCATELVAADQAGDTIARGLIAGAAMSQMRELLTDEVMGSLMPIVGSPLGMKTDRRYDSAQVRDMVLEGLLKGARVVGNEMNFLGGNLYLTKEYWERRFRELDGVSEVREPTLGIPKQTKIGDKLYATTQAKLVYRVDGKLRTTACTGDDAITVIWNKTDRLETMYGKVKKRLYAIAFAEVAGMAVDLDDDVPIDAPFSTTVEERPMDALTHAKRSTIAKIIDAPTKERLDEQYGRWTSTEEQLGPTFDAADIEAARCDVQEAYKKRNNQISFSASPPEILSFSL